MEREVFWDTSGFFALLNSDDAAHEHAKAWIASSAPQHSAVTTEWIIGECCTLLLARKRPHLVPMFLDHAESSNALIVVNPDQYLIANAKLYLRKHLDRGYSFVDCLSFCLMQERGTKVALTTDSHFRSAGFHPLLV